MAIEKNIKINVDTKEAVSDVNKLDKSFKDLDNQTEKTSTGLKDVGENGGAIALLDSVTGGLATRFRDAYEATKLFNFSLKGTRTALIATGIGAFVVALGLVVAYWSDIKDFITGSNTALAKQIESTETLLQLQKDQLSNLDASDETLKRQGKTQEEINKLKKDQLKIIIATAKENLIEEKRRQEELLNLKTEGGSTLQQFGKSYGDFFVKIYGFIDDLFSKIGINLGLSDTLAGGLDWIFEGVFGTEEDLLNAAEKIAETERQIIEAQNRLDGILNKEDEAAKGDGIERGQQENVLEDGLTFEDNITLGSKNLLNELLEDADITFKKNQSIRDEKALNEVAANAEREKQYKEDVKNATIGLAVQTFNILGALAEEGSALAKGVAVAQATIDTYKGAVAAYAAGLSVGGPAGLVIAPIAAGLTVAAGLVNISKILATKPVSTTAPSGGAGGRAPAPPSFNLVQGTASNQINDSLQTQEPVRAIVVSRDVTSAQEANRNSENNSTL